MMDKFSNPGGKKTKTKNTKLVFFTSISKILYIRDLIFLICLSNSSNSRRQSQSSFGYCMRHQSLKRVTHATYTGADTRGAARPLQMQGGVLRFQIYYSYGQRRTRAFVFWGAQFAPPLKTPFLKKY